MFLDLQKKTGHISMDNAIRIYDEAGQIFYKHDRTDGKPTHFNLPRGKYTTTNKLKEVEPRKYKLPMLPPKERHRKVSSRLQKVYGPNPHKASIYFDQNKILLDYSIKNLPKPQRVHVVLHEIAHHFYKTEAYCDLWAAREMLVRGYNPSQVFFAVFNTLSNNSQSSIDRKGFILDNCEGAFKK